MSFWCLFLDKDLTKNHSNIGVHFKRCNPLKLFTLNVCGNLSRDSCQYMHASHGQLTYFTRKMPYDIGKICKSTIIIHLHVYFNDTCWLPRTPYPHSAWTQIGIHKPWYGAQLNHLMGGGGGCFELHRCSVSMGILRNKWTSEWRRIIATASAPCTTIWPMAKCTYRYAHIPLIYSPKHLEIVCCPRVLPFQFIQHWESPITLFITMFCALLEKIAKKNRSRFPIAVLLTTLICSR